MPARSSSSPATPPHRGGLLAAIGSALVLLPPTIRAETIVDTGTGQGGALEEIQVTAERRDTDLQKTALAITTVSMDALDKSNVNDLAGLNGMVPGLEITKSSGFETITTIRGVGDETPENAPTTVPGVALFVDGVYIANTISLDQTLFDVDRIEVLRGPQGALYGESSIGGAISVVTRQPELGKFSGSGDVTAGNYGLARERAEVNIPVGDTLAVRLSVQKYDHDGFTRDTAIPDYYLDDAHDQGGKAAILWKPTDNFSATLTGQWYQSNENGAAQKNVDDPNSDPRTVTQDYPSKFRLHNQLFHLNLEWDLPYFLVKSISAYQSLDHRQQEDSSRSAISLFGSYDDVAAWNTTLKNYNEELDLLSLPGSRFEWIGGVFLMRQTSTQFVAEFEGTTPTPDVTLTPDIQTAPPGNLAYGNSSTVSRKSYSPFLQGTFHIADDLRLTAGVRYNHDTYSEDSHNFSQYAVDDVVHGYSGHATTGRLELDYDLTPDALLYASAARGYKPGGVNGIASAVVVPNTFKLETNTAYEIGSKNMFLDRHLRFNAAAFFYVYHDMQYIEQDPVPFDGGMSNIPSVHAWGGEFETSYVTLEDKLRINANLTLEDSAVQGNYRTIDSTVSNAIEGSAPACAYGGAYYSAACWNAVIASARNIGGNQLPKMPKIAGSINAAYAVALPFGVITPRVEYVYRGSEWARVFEEASIDRIKAYGIFNFNATYVPPGSHFTAALTATNIANKAGVNSQYTDPYGTGQTSVQYIAPRQVMATVGFSF